ncbi:MAG: hypothetical protein ABI183_17355, partial [Polyangiaceae bacterium]
VGDVHHVSEMKARNAYKIAGLAFIASCTLFGTSNRVKSGELVETGDARYDAYFKDVHDMQVTAVGWSDERQAACRPLVDELRLAPEAAGVSIVQETHERVKEISHDVGPTKLEVTGDEAHVTADNPQKVDETTRNLFKMIETCAHTELARSHAFKDVPARVDAVVKTGRELEPHIRDDFAKHGGRVAEDVQSEMTASYDALSDISKNARGGAREAEDFVADLQRAVGSPLPAPPKDDADEAPKGKKKKGDKSDKSDKGSEKSADKSDKPAPDKPADKPTPPPADKPKPKPKPPPPPASEDFNP